MHTPMFAEPLVAAALEAAAEDAATEEAAVEVLEEPPQAVIAAVAPTTADAFRKSRREIIFIIMFSFNSYLSIFTGAILHAPVIPVRIIPLQHPTVQENKFTRLKEFFCAISTNAFWARQFLFSKHHNFSYICNLPTKAKKLCHFSLKKITKCCIVRFLQLFYFLYILKNIFRNSSSLFFRIFSLHFRNFLQIACSTKSATPYAAARRIRSNWKNRPSLNSTPQAGKPIMLQCDNSPTWPCRKAWMPRWWCLPPAAWERRD
jgi:hypothetical protein